MADTKQATPELEVIVEEIWRHYNRGDTTDAVLTLKAALDSRSGPDRTAQESQKCAKCGKESPVAMCAANCDDMFCNRCIWDHETVCELTEAGPDRTPDTVEYWKSRATTAELKVLTFHEEIVKLRSGPDRGQQDAPLDGKLHGAQPISEDWEQVWDLLDRWKQVWHGDRGKYISEYPAWIVSASEELFAHDMCDAWNWNDYVKAAAVIIQRHFAAKAAREGQESRGDRIKVEREPGCKCEYAIWTNAKGCPLHDVSDPVQAVRVGQAPTGDGK